MIMRDGKPKTAKDMIQTEKYINELQAKYPRDIIGVDYGSPDGDETCVVHGSVDEKGVYTVKSVEYFTP